MKITLNINDIRQLMRESDTEIEFDLPAFKTMGLDEAIAKAITEQTAQAGPLYQEIRKQVDKYLNQHMQTEVGNYIRTQDHTTNRIITEAVKKEIEAGIRNGIEHYAKKKATQIANTLLGDLEE